MSDFLSFIILLIAGWIHRLQVAQIECLKEEVCVLREHIPDKRIRFTDAQRLRLAREAKAVGRKSLKDLSGAARRILCCVGSDSCPYRKFHPRRNTSIKIRM